MSVKATGKGREVWTDCKGAGRRRKEVRGDYGVVRKNCKEVRAKYKEAMGKCNCL